MGYFPSDIPFMSEEELKENGIKIPRDQFATDVYIYNLDLNAENPVVEKIFAEVRTDGEHGDTDVIYWITQEDYEIWHSAFDTSMIGVVYEPLSNVVELIVERDGTTSDKALILIQGYCRKKAAMFRKQYDLFNKGIGAAEEFYIRDVWNV